MIRIDDERGGMWRSSSILSFWELGWEREARRAAPLRAISSESGPNPAWAPQGGSHRPRGGASPRVWAFGRNEGRAPKG